jgi:hypothetical protein
VSSDIHLALDAPHSETGETAGAMAMRYLVASFARMSAVTNLPPGWQWAITADKNAPGGLALVICQEAPATKGVLIEPNDFEMPVHQFVDACVVVLSGVPRDEPPSPFCHRKNECAGRSSCPRNPACTE